MLLSFLAGVLLHMAPLPPVEYIRNRDSVIRFVEDANTITNCGVSTYGQIVACAGVNNDWIIMPNPCMFPDDPYARVLCHELGHNNGWPSDHPNPREFLPETPAPQTSPQTRPEK